MKSLVRLAGCAVAALAFLATPATAQTIHLNAGAIDTSTPAPAQRAAADTAGDRLHLVQFDGPIQPEWVAQLEASGYRIVDYVPDNTYIVYGGATARKTLRAGLSHVHWQGAFLATDKINPRARPEELLKRKSADADSNLFAIQLVHDEEANAESIAYIEAFALAPIRSVVTNEQLGFVNIIVDLPASALADIATFADVLNINTYIPPKKRGERQGQIVAGNLNGAGSQPSGPGYLNWLTNTVGFSQAQFDSSGFIVDIADDGWDRGVATNPANPEFRKAGSAANASRVKYSQYSSNLSQSNSHGLDGHGNINVSIVGGYNDLTGSPYVDGDGYHRGLGINPFANMGNTKVFADGGTWIPSSTQERTFIATNHYRGVRISSDSWGSTGDGSYDVSSQDYDTWTRDSRAGVAGNQETLFVFAAGNDGPGSKTIGPPGSGKNIISVGAAENYNQTGTDGCATPNSGANNANDIIDFSSRGPCTDNRIKPDIVAPGTHIAGAASFMTGYTGDGVCDKYQPAGQTNYAASSGTSHSTPAVAGGASLVYQYFLNQVWGTPSPAMTKAYLMNATRYMNGVYANDTLPSNNQGMGMMHLGLAFDGIPRVLRDQLTNDLFTASGQSRTFYANVYSATNPVRITLGWTDAPGSLSGNAYKNNLNLEVNVNGTTYKGNVFSGATSTTGGTADVRNNVESVFLPAGTTGLVTIVVTAANINSDGVPNYGGSLDQDFVLVAYNATAYTPSNVPPSIEPIGNKTVLTNQLLQFTVTANDPIDGDSIALSATGIPGWATFPGATNTSAASAQFSGTAPTATGTYNVTFFAADKDGTNSEAIVITVTDVSCVSTNLLSENFDASASVPTNWVNGSTANDTSSSHYQSSPNCRSFGTGATLETPAVNYPTQIVFFVDASSGGNGKSGLLEYKIGAGAWTTVGSFNASTTGSNVTFDLTSSPNLASSANVAFRFSSSFNTWYLDNVVVNGLSCAGGGGGPTNTPPSISVAGGTNQTGAVGSELSFVVTGSDPDGDTVTLRTNSAPTGAIFPTGNGIAPIESTFTWTPSATGAYIAVFTVNDGALTVTQVVSISVGPAVIPLLPPEIQAASGVQADQFTANWLASSNATGYRLDVSTNETFSGGGGGVVLSENFSLFTPANGSTDISGSLDTYTQTSGWTGEKVYTDGGRAKLGSSSARGVITTPTIDLSANGGAATLHFEIGQYGTDAGAVQVMHAPDGSTFAQVGSDITPPATMTLQTLSITGGTASSKIQFYAKGLSKNRFLLDAFQLESGGGSPDFVPGYENRDIGNATSASVTGLANSVTYYYRARAYNSTSNSANSATTNITTSAGSNVPPTLNPIGNKSVTISNALLFAVSATPTDGDTVTLTASNLPSGATFGSTNENGSFSWPNPTPVGTYNVSFYATDKDGSDSETIAITVQAGGGGPGDCTNLLFQGFEAGNSWTIATGSNGISSAAGASDTPPSQRIRTGSYSWQANNASSTLELASMPIAGSTGRQVSVRLSSTSTTAANGADSTDLARIYVALNGSAFSATPDIIVAGNNNARWGYGATNDLITTAGTLVSNRVDSGGTLTNAPANLYINIPDSATSIALRVIANNNASQEIWSIDDIALWGCTSAAGQPPVLNAIGNQSVTISNALLFAVSATPTDGDTVTLTVSNLPSGATFGSTNENGSFSWPNPTPTGIYNVVFYATDKDGSTSSNVTITVLSNDTDNDGMDDQWELDNFGDLDIADEDSDTDLDGFSDVNEFLAGTDPNDPASLLIMTHEATQISGSGIVIRWQSASNRLYDVSRSTNHLETFTTIAPALPATPPENVYTDTAPANAHGVYRIDLNQQP